MPRTLIAEEFSAAKLGKVSGFDCGDEPWAVYAAKWIAAPLNEHGALKAIATRGTRVWLYFDLESDELVGFGSLGTTLWPNYAPDRVSVIPQLAIQRQFCGQPKGVGEKKYSHQLLDDLIARARLQASHRLVLTVDPANTSARRLYSDIFQFEELADLSPMGHVKMTLLLSEPTQPHPADS